MMVHETSTGAAWDILGWDAQKYINMSSCIMIVKKKTLDDQMSKIAYCSTVISGNPDQLTLSECIAILHGWMAERKATIEIPIVMVDA